MKRFGRLTFATKLMIVYICSLLFGICSATVNQIHVAANILEKESSQNLRMLTEQVALNFRENQQSLGYSIYSRMAALEIPSLMDSYSQKESTTSLADVRYALAQTITESSDYGDVRRHPGQRQRNRGGKAGGYSGQLRFHS